ncbi:DnrN [Staphylococcus aureus]|nr:DnrN [Staphylococcus aureus]
MINKNDIVADIVIDYPKAADIFWFSTKCGGYII